MANPDLVPVSWDTHNINDETHYTARFDPGDEWGLPDIDVQMVERMSSWPLVAGVNRPAHEVNFWIKTGTGSTTRQYRDELLDWFNPESACPHQLVIENTNGAQDRYIEGVCSSILPMGGASVNLAKVFNVTIQVHGDVRWRKTTATCAVWDISGSETTVTNAGTDEAYPIITITPTVAKTSSTYEYSMFVPVRWNCDESYTGYPLDIMSGSWDTTTLIKSSTCSQLSGSVPIDAGSMAVDSISGFPVAGMGYITDASSNDEQIRWTGVDPASPYPFITGLTRSVGGTTAASHSGSAAIHVSKMLVNGDDVVVEVDSASTYRWFSGLNSASTKVFANVNFQTEWSSTVTASAAAIDSITSMSATTSTINAPNSGILGWSTGSLVELLTYTGKDDTDWTFSGITRGVKGTTAASHAAGAKLWWCQKSIRIKYGNEAAATPTMDDNYEPMFDAGSSTNTQWHYALFGEDDTLRSGQWQESTSWGSPTFSGGSQGSKADPWTDPGISATNGKGRFYLFNPCAVTSCSIGGLNYATDTSLYTGNAGVSYFDGKLWIRQQAITAPSAASEWCAWTYDVTISDKTRISFFTRSRNSSYTNQTNAASAIVALNSGSTPVIEAMLSEETAYALDCTLANSTTGSSLKLAMTMDLADTLELDTSAKTVTFGPDNSNQYPALSIIGPPRKNWLHLTTGSNGLTFSDSGTASGTINVEYVERYY